MVDYIAAIVHSNVTTDVFVKAALAKDPPLLYRIFENSFSFVDQVLSPMVIESQKLVARLKDEYKVNSAGVKIFSPNFGLRNILVDNIDLVLDTEDSPALKDMQCHLE